MAIIYQEIKRHNRPWGIELTMVFSEGGDILRNTTFRFDNTAQITSELTDRSDRKVFSIEVAKSALNQFDLGEDSREILIKLITAIRANNDLTIQQSINWYNSNYPDSLWNGTNLLKKFRTWLTKELGFEPTWDQFKTYVINNKFEALDNYDD